MRKYELEKCFDGYIIHQTGDEVPGKWGLYLTSTSKYGYKWGFDYTYAKAMTLKTAKKHLAILQEATK
ncbi:hypothetical protein [Butyrivibrio sp. AE2032]|uniref:hypothetical protein n=1 Tax=Butyrivibrio sp. AE2032 TaxID=1458463 RepID=UPI0005583FB6|nr:hypothetical protein [Butyrivibrio sp. AE2032]